MCRRGGYCPFPPKPRHVCDNGQSTNTVSASVEGRGGFHVPAYYGRKSRGDVCRSRNKVYVATYTLFYAKMYGLPVALVDNI